MYCENCGKEDLDYWEQDDIGACFCCVECFEQFYATDNECTNTSTRYLINHEIEE